MGAVRLYGWSTLRRQWLIFVALGLVAAIAGGLVLAAWAGARRTHSSLERLLEQTRHGDVTAGLAPGDLELWDEIAGWPEVEAAATITAMAIIAAPDLDSGTFSFFGVDPTDRYGNEIMRPLLLRGRRADPVSSDEVALHESLAAAWAVDVGDTVSMSTWVGGNFQTAVETGEISPNGPIVQLRVVGIVRAPADVVGNTGVLVSELTPGFASAHPEIDRFVQLGVLRLHGGRTDAAAFIQKAQSFVDLAHSTGTDTSAGEPTYFGTDQVVENLSGALSTAERGQLIFAFVGAIATLLTITLALSRLVELRDRTTLSALGMRRRAHVAASLLPVVIAAVVAAVGTLALAYFGSRVFMPRLARIADPDPGPRPDLVIASAAVAGALLLVVIAAAVGARTERHRPAHARGSPRLWARGGAPVLLASSLARSRAGGRGRIAVAALVGVVTALAGLTAGAMYVGSLDDLEHDHERWGLAADFTAPVELIDAVYSIVGVEAAATLRFGFAVIEGTTVHTVAFEPEFGDLSPELLAGRLPDGHDEVALSSRFFGDGVSVGSTVVVLDADRNPLSFEVVGQAIAPQVDGRGSVRNGALVSAAGFARIGVGSPGAVIAVRMAPGVDASLAIASMHAELVDVVPVEQPPSIANLAAVRGLVVWLIALLLFMGTSSAALSFLGSFRRSRPNIAVAKAIGMTNASVRFAFLIFAGGVAVVGAVVAAIVGFVGGRFVWRLQGEQLGVRATAVVPWSTLAVLFAAATVGIALVGVVISGRSVRTRAAEVFRAERQE